MKKSGDGELLFLINTVSCSLNRQLNKSFSCVDVAKWLERSPAKHNRLDMILS